MAIKWEDLATSFYNKASWDETVTLWKNSIVLGWYNSIVVAAYTTAFGALKFQFMLGGERKINVANKYEWYYAQPTKVLMNGEGKIDLVKTKKTTPSSELFALAWTVATNQHERDVLADILKAGNATETVVNTKTESYGTHVLNCAVGGSSEDVLQKTITAEASLKLSGSTSVAIQSGEVSIAMSPTSIMLTAPTINIG